MTRTRNQIAARCAVAALLLFALACAACKPKQPTLTLLVWEGYADPSFIGAFEEAVAIEARRRNVDGIICGHIHHAADRVFAGVHYLNCGDWVESCTAVVETLAGELSYGRKRALEIATTLALEPEMMLLDEPTAGMAHEDVDRISALIKQVAKNRTVLMVEHNLSVVEHLSDTITVLARGEILAEGDYAAVSANPDVVQAYLGVGHE